MSMFYIPLLPLSLEALETYWGPSISSIPNLDDKNSVFQPTYATSTFLAAVVTFYSNSSIDTPGLKPCHVTFTE